MITNIIAYSNTHIYCFLTHLSAIMIHKFLTVLCYIFDTTLPSQLQGLAIIGILLLRKLSVPTLEEVLYRKVLAFRVKAR